MKKQDFLSAVRLGINNKSSDALKKIVLDFARLLSRDDFEEALLSLEKSDVIVVKNTSTDLLSAVKQLCESVKNGDYSLTWNDESGYYDGYYSEDETLSDKDGLGEEIQCLLDTALVYAEKKRYAEVFSTFDQLFSLVIPMEDYDDLDVHTLFAQDLITSDLAEILRQYAYTALMTLHGSKRVQKLYEIEIFSRYNLEIREIAQAGADEIPQRDKFEKEWIEFLMRQNLYHHEHILIEAVLFSGGIKNLHDFTMKHGVKYQSAYIRLAEMYIVEKEYEQAVGVIRNGFFKLDVINSVRAKLADLLLDMGKAAHDKNLIEEAVREGFYASLDLRHFLNICNLNDENMKALAIKHLEKYQNKSDDENYIRFLYGDYETVYQTCASDKNFLGWSSSEKGKILPLFIALLTGQESLSLCLKKLIEFNFRHSGIKESFFVVLTESFKVLPDEVREKYFKWCLKESEGRVEAIVRGQHRGSYDRASALIVSLAEVMRSADDKAGAEKLIRSYKEKYPRHTAFHGCLRQDTGLAKFGKLI